MTTLIHAKIGKTIVACAMIAIVAVPVAFADQSPSVRVSIPARLANFHEPGSTGYVANATQVTIPARLANFHEPGSTGYVANATQVTIPARLTNFHEPGSTGYVPATTRVVTLVPVGGGFDWVSALIGAGVAAGIAMAGMGGLLALRKRRTIAHV